MPDLPLPSSPQNVQGAPDELNLTDPAVDKPRLKRRSLKGRSSSAEDLRPDLSESASDPRPDSPRPEYPRPDAPRVEPVARANSSVPAAKPAAGNPFTSTSTNPPPSSQSLPTTPLYYTTGVRKDKEDAQPMKTSPASAATPTASTSASGASSPARPTPTSTSSPARPVGATSSARPATAATSYQSRPAAASASRPAASSAPASSYVPTSTVASSSSRGASVNDFRANVERQSREQKSVDGMISIIVYALAGLFVLGALLAAYGTYTISRQMHRQSVTMSDLDNRYTAQNQALTAQLKASNDSLTEALTQTRAQLSRQEELLTRQQDFINKLTMATEANTASWRQERQTRAAEAATLRTRIRDLEDQPRLGPGNRQ